MTPTDLASVLRHVEDDVDEDAAAQELARLLGLDRSAEEALARIIGEAHDSGYYAGFEDGAHGTETGP